MQEVLFYGGLNRVPSSMFTSRNQGARQDPVCLALLTQNAQSSGTSIRETVPPAATVGS
jgi:hypothetical protein